MKNSATQSEHSEALLELRRVMGGDGVTPVVDGEFFVAAYQRGYRWGPEEVRLLLDDILDHRKQAEKRGERPTNYFLQPIVVLKRDDGSWELVDGQQRLTTLFLITKYLTTTIPQAKAHYDLSYETRKKSREFLNSLGTPAGAARSRDNIDFHHMASAYNAIVEWFDGQPNARNAAFDIHAALSQWVYVIWYEAPTGTDPNELFTRLNRDRIPLTDAELIKALVLSSNGAANGKTNRQLEIAAQWDGFEKSLGDDQFWAFLTGSRSTPATRIDFLFETMTADADDSGRSRFRTFSAVQKQITERGVARFWEDVVALHGLLTGWFEDRELYHWIGYLVQVGYSIQELIKEYTNARTHSAFREELKQRIREQLNLKWDDVSGLRYGRDNRKCEEVLLLMNVQTVLGTGDPGSRFPYSAYVGDHWSLEHVHAQNAEEFQKESQRRDWLQAHLPKVKEHPSEQGELVKAIEAHLALPEGNTDSQGFTAIFNDVVALYSGEGAGNGASDLHGLGNLALLQRDHNSKLNNAVFPLKRERIIELDRSGAYILPCTRNVFLKYYTTSAEQQLSLWGPRDQVDYLDALMGTIEDFLLDTPATREAER